MISHAHSRSANPIKNANNPWSLPRAQLQSFLFFNWPMPSYPTPISPATGADTVVQSQGEPNDFQFPTCIVVSVLLQLLFCKYSRFELWKVGTISWLLLNKPLFALLCQLFSCFHHCNDLYYIKSICAQKRLVLCIFCPVSLNKSWKCVSDRVLI